MPRPRASHGDTRPPVRAGTPAIKDETIREVFSAIIARPNAPSRKDLAHELDRSPATVTRAVKWLEDYRWVMNGNTREGRGQAGPKETVLRVDPKRAYSIGISIRASRNQLAGIVMNLEGQLVGEPSHRTLKDSNEAAVVQNIGALFDELVSGLGEKPPLLGIGLAIGGHVDSREGLVRSCWHFTPAWRGVPLRERIQEAIGLPTTLENNANALAIHEQWFGQGRGLQHFIVVWVDRGGVGFGIVNNGSLLRGATGLAGELGHWVTKDTSIDCVCGNHGCLEAVIKDAATRFDARDFTKVTQAGESLGRALALVQLAVDPERIIVCGGSAGLVNSSLFRGSVAEGFDKHAFRFSGRRDLIVWGALDNQKVARGAACMPLQHLSVSRMRELALT